MSAVVSVVGKVRVTPILCALGLSVATFYRRRQERRPAASRTPSPRALGAEERKMALDLLHSERFVDRAPAEVYAALLDEGRYLCSERTMYRLLAANQEVRERRDQLRHPAYRKPELMATGPNQVWSWDITKLKTEAKWVYLYLYVILDIFSRYVVGWMLAQHENAHLAERLVRETYDKHGVAPGQLVLHADRGSPMKAKPMVQLLSALDVVRSHSRPHVSDDNPFSESQFRTLKYHPEFPDRFGGLDDGLAFCRTFFPWYNDEHHHSGIAFLTPSDVHYGRADEVLRRRRVALTTAYAAHPERFPRGVPAPAPLPSAVWINKPKPQPAPSGDGGFAVGSSALELSTAKGGAVPGAVGTLGVRV
jgi:putative transposase